MKKTILVIIIIIAALLILNSSKKQDLGDKVIKIGVMAPMSDIFASFGEDILSGIQEVVGENKNIELVVEDTGCVPSKSVSAFNKLINIDKVQYIIGPACGSPQEAIAPLVKENDVLVILPSAATDKIFESGGNKMYQIQYSLEQEAKMMAEKMNSEFEKVALISYQNAFSAAQVESFKEYFEGELVADIVFKDNTSDVSTDVTKLKNVDIDAIVVVDSAFFFAQGLAKINQFGIEAPVFSNYVMEHPSLRELAEGVTYTFPEGIGDNGTTNELAKISASVMIDSIEKCGGEYECVVNSFSKSKDFNSEGIRTQDIVFKQIVDGETILLEE